MAGDKWTIYGTDSICSFFNTDSIGTVIVDSVKTVLVNGWPLKAIYTSPDSLSEWFYSEVILERIGCLDHMLPRAINCAVDVIPGNGSLRCFEHPALGFFTNNCCNPSPSFCERLVFYNGIDELQINFSVYPNPAHDFLNVHNIAGNHEKMQVKLYNVNMQLVYIKSIFANQLSIPILGFQPGLYFVEVSTLKESFRKKIIVQ
ncbi:MAG: T9SS type A sorting domain-containing protein [Draconibacterium sp.]|nr:T9SS type A sorting domain-containing protein [Draconibacterium sp.]